MAVAQPEPTHSPAMFYRRDIIHVEAEDVVRRRQLTLRILQFVLLAVFIGSFVKLASGPMPWSKSVLQRIEEAPDLENPKALTGFGPWLKSEIDHPKTAARQGARHHRPVVWGRLRRWRVFLLLLTIRWWMPQGEHSLMLPEILEEEADSENAGDRASPDCSSPNRCSTCW